MEQISNFFSRKSGSFPNLMTRKSEIYLPVTTKPKSRFQVKAVLSHCLYRRVVIWTVVVIILVSVSLLNPRLAKESREVFDFVQGSKERPKEVPIIDEIADVPEEEVHNENPDVQLTEEKEEHDHEQGQENTEAEAEEVEEEAEEEGDEPDNERTVNGPNWMAYKHMNGYYNGLRALVPFSEYQPEYPKTSPAPAVAEPPHPVHHTKLPKPTIYKAHPDYDSSEYQREYVPVRRCYIDEGEKIPAPDLWAYAGVPQGQAKAALGSYDLLGLREDVCFDRFGRYGPYGLGYDLEEGGTGEAMDTEHEGSEIVWEKTGKINYDDVDWASAQLRCFKSNEDRFFTGNETMDAELAKHGHRRMDRQAVVIRTYVGFEWTSYALLNFRAMVNELNLRAGGEYDVHFLLHVRDNNAPIWADPDTAQKILDANVPPEFHGLCTLWSEAQMKLYYPGNFGNTFENPSNGDIHGVYRSAHMPLQHFANLHPEYAHFWNWEMDMRWTGSYYELFDRLGKWGAKQSRQGMWERAGKYYIPAFHGSWENFTDTVQHETQSSGKRSILGPVVFTGKTGLQAGENFMPGSCSHGSDMSQCGVGEDADLITLNPLFDANESGWVFAGDVTGYDTQYDKPPRRCAIVTASRLSRRLLSVMHEETWRLHHSMFSEMFPPTMAFHHGLKAVYAPHPVFLDRDWPQKEIEKAFNGGRDHSTGGHGSPFDVMNEHNHKGTSWYYNSEFAGLLWRRWLGYAQMDGQGSNGGRAGQGTKRGGQREEENPKKSGRMCLRSMLVHPIKWENPAELSH
ncbi:hypothetical protein F4778DRAFT_593419 [Xylariomycetidae sp. FL2044]|nr:hypothetical protein F4778DRAFT_593419 [Xylariomycetidae sp. FL2044]